MAPSRSGPFTSRGVIESQAGALGDMPALKANVVSSSATGVAMFNETNLAKAPITTTIATSAAMRRRRSSKTSASAPAGNVNKTTGRLAAT